MYGIINANIGIGTGHDSSAWLGMSHFIDLEK